MTTGDRPDELSFELLTKGPTPGDVIPMFGMNNRPHPRPPSRPTRIVQGPNLMSVNHIGPNPLENRHQSPHNLRPAPRRLVQADYLVTGRFQDRG